MRCTYAGLAPGGEKKIDPDRRKPVSDYGELRMASPQPCKSRRTNRACGSGGCEAVPFPETHSKPFMRPVLLRPPTLHVQSTSTGAEACRKFRRVWRVFLPTPGAGTRRQNASASSLFRGWAH